MAIFLYDHGAENILYEYFLPRTFKVILFTNDAVQSETGELVEAFGGGYARVTVTETDTASNAIVDGIAQQAYNPIVFNFTGLLTTNGTVYGYAFMRSTTPAADGAGTTTFNDIVFSDKLSSPFVPDNGTQLTIIPTFRLSHGTPSA